MEKYGEREIIKKIQKIKKIKQILTFINAQNVKVLLAGLTCGEILKIRNHLLVGTASLKVELKNKSHFRVILGILENGKTMFLKKIPFKQVNPEYRMRNLM